MSGPIFKNERTMASAGSGKTYALTNRFIALMLGGSNPEEICALTFTRKAAGEFFEKTITKLADAAGDEKLAKSLSEQMQALSKKLQQADAKTFLKILEKFVKSAPMLHMETIDAFAARYVSFFAAELGVGEKISIMDDYALSNFKAETISRTLSAFSKDKNTFAQFAEAFRIANMGRESKSVLSDLSQFVEYAHAIFLSHPDISKWGNISAYGRKNLANWSDERYLELLASFKDELESISDKSELKAKTYLLNFFEAARPKNIPQASNKAVKALADHVYKNKSAHNFQVPASKGENVWGFSDKAAATIDAMLAMLIEGDINLSCESLKAVGKIMDAYESLYRENVQKKGLMSFSDIPLAIGNSSFMRDIVEYRFDSKFSHWLFDEFQDTSRAQWNIFENLIDEAVLNSEGEKTFYYVGDIKQSIYSWRGGDPKLFDEIKERFGEKITDNPQIKTSWRSSKAVIDTVNKIFGDAKAIELHFGKNAAERWNAIWKNHDVADRNLSMPACVSAQAYDEDMPEAVYRHILNVKPLERGLSCAVLTRRNPTAESIVEHIRKRAAEDGLSLRAAGELEVKIASDNMAIPALLAFACAACHPLDSLSREYVLMTPMREYVSENPDSVFEAFLQDSAAFGFAKAFAAPAKFLEGKAKDLFTKTRISQFVEMTELFDAKNDRNCDSFIDFAKKYKIREGAASDTIQVMSIHKAKGLDFDLVIIPELEKIISHAGLQIETLKDGSIVRAPSKKISVFDERLSEIKKEIEDKSAFESLCLYYVALTRAKNSMHIILKKRKPSDDPENTGDFARMFADIFPCETEEVTIIEGSAAWMEKFETGKAATDSDTPKNAHIFACLKSENKEFKIRIADYANPNIQITFGNCAHSILENLSENECDAKKSAQSVEHLYRDDAEILFDAQCAVEKILADPEIRKIFEHKNYWTEKPYYFSKNGKMRHGRFDRINFYPEENRAEIIDFKSHSDEDNADYKEQLLRYEEAFKTLCPVENVSLKILSVVDGKIICV